MKWQILIPTIQHRTEIFTTLMESLAPQLEAANGEVEVLVFRDNLEANIGDKRQRLVDESTAEYINHVDDDDLLADDYVSTLLPLMDGVDTVTYDLLVDAEGLPDGFTVKTSIEFTPYWYGTHKHCDIGHLMPMRREIHSLGSWNGGWEDDLRWRDGVLGNVKTENRVEKALYTYRVSNGSLWRGDRAPMPEPTPNPEFKYVRYIEP